MGIIVGEETGYVIDIVSPPVGHNLLHLFHEKGIGLLNLTFVNHNLTVQIESLLLVNGHHMTSIFPCGVVVLFGHCLSGFVKYRSYRIGIIFHCQIDGTFRFLGPVAKLVIIGYVGQVVGIHKNAVTLLDSLLVLTEKVFEFLGFEIFLVVIYHVRLYFQTNSLVEDGVFGCRV